MTRAEQHAHRMAVYDANRKCAHAFRKQLIAERCGRPKHAKAWERCCNKYAAKLRDLMASEA